MNELKLTLHKKAFEVMVTGEKKEEFRKPTNWILRRLYDRNGKRKWYDTVRFTNGYGAKRPYFVCGFNSFDSLDSVHKEYSNGLSFNIGECVVIKLGEIIEKGNLPE